MPIHSTHSHNASEDTEEDPARIVATRSRHFVRDMVLPIGRKLTHMIGLPFLRPSLPWARNCLRIRLSVFTNLPRAIRNPDFKTQKEIRKFLKVRRLTKEPWNLSPVIRGQRGITSQDGVHKRKLLEISNFLQPAPSPCPGIRRIPNHYHAKGGIRSLLEFRPRDVQTLQALHRVLRLTICAEF